MVRLFSAPLLVDIRAVSAMMVVVVNAAEIGTSQFHRETHVVGVVAPTTVGCYGI